MLPFNDVPPDKDSRPRKEQNARRMEEPMIVGHMVAGVARLLGTVHFPFQGGVSRQAVAC